MTERSETAPKRRNVTEKAPWRQGTSPSRSPQCGGAARRESLTERSEMAPKGRSVTDSTVGDNGGVDVLVEREMSPSDTVTTGTPALERRAVARRAP